MTRVVERVLYLIIVVVLALVCSGLFAENETLRSEADAVQFDYQEAYDAGCIDTIDGLRVFRDPDDPEKVQIDVSYGDGTGLERFEVPVLDLSYLW